LRVKRTTYRDPPEAGNCQHRRGWWSGFMDVPLS
jgi:hypothetical protein